MCAQARAQEHTPACTHNVLSLPELVVEDSLCLWRDAILQRLYMDARVNALCGFSCYLGLGAAQKQTQPKGMSARFLQWHTGKAYECGAGLVQIQQNQLNSST